MKHDRIFRASPRKMDFALQLKMPRTYVQAIDFVLAPQESRSAFIRKAIRTAVELELRRRRPPQSVNEVAE